MDVYCLGGVKLTQQKIVFFLKEFLVVSNFFYIVIMFSGKEVAKLRGLRIRIQSLHLGETITSSDRDGIEMGACKVGYVALTSSK